MIDIVAIHEITGHKVAVKILNKKKIKQQNVFEKVKREIKVLRHFNHPHIVKHYEFIDTPSDIFMVIEYAAGGELFDYISRRERLSEQEARHLFQQLYSAISYCHRQKIAHRDLKPENLLLDENNLNLKLIDFGLSNSMRDSLSLKTACGSPNYASPEIVSGRSYGGVESDLWSMGVILYAMLSGSLPFDDESMSSLFKKIKDARYHMPNFISEEAQDLIARMLQPNPIKRITMKELAEHPWFNKDKPAKYLGIGEFIGKDKSSQAVNEDIIKHLVTLDVIPLQYSKEEIHQQIKEKRNTEYCGIYELYSHDILKQQTMIANQNLNLIQESMPLKTYFKSRSSPKLQLKLIQKNRQDIINQRLRTGQACKTLQFKGSSKNILFPFCSRNNSTTSTNVDSSCDISKQNSLNTALSFSPQKQSESQLQDKLLTSPQLFSQKWQFGLIFPQDHSKISELLRLLSEALRQFEIEWQFSKSEQKFKCRTRLSEDDIADIQEDSENFQSYLRSKFLKFQISILKTSSPDPNQKSELMLDFNLMKGSPIVYLDFINSFFALLQSKIAKYLNKQSDKAAHINNNIRRGYSKLDSLLYIEEENYQNSILSSNPLT